MVESTTTSSPKINENSSDQNTESELGRVDLATEQPPRLFKKVVRPKTNLAPQLPSSMEEQPVEEEVILVRVRRQRESEPLEALELSFAQASNVLKRQRLVTQSDALVEQFNAVVQLDEDKMKLGSKSTTVVEESKGGFVLGAKSTHFSVKPQQSKAAASSTNL